MADPTSADLVKSGMWPASADQMVALAKRVVTFDLVAASVNKWVFVADRAYTVESIKEIHSVVGSTGANAKIRKVTDTSAPGASAGATVVELVTSGLDLTTTINTTVAPSIVAAGASLAAGDKLGVLMAGTLTGLVGHVTIVLVPA